MSGDGATGTVSPVPLGEGAAVACPYCGEELWLAVDPSGGGRQRFVTDCEVCCRAIDVLAIIDPEGEIEAHVRREDDPS